MKRFCLLCLLGVLSLSLFAQGVNEFGKERVRVAALKGPTAMGLVKLMHESEEGRVRQNEYTFSIIASPTEMTPRLVKGEVDIAALPANLASILYQNTKGQIQVLAVNTLGVLYLVENGHQISSIEDVKGKTIYASGKGSTPEYALLYLLEKAGLTVGKDVFVEWKSEHAECVAALSQKKEAVALLPQPFVTTALMQNSQMHIALDLNEAWESYHPESKLITGVVVARKSFVSEHEEAVKRFLESYEESVSFVNAYTNEAATLVGKYNIVPETVAQKALPYCHIVCLTGEELKQNLAPYLEVLYKANPKSVGGALPEEDFYY